MVNQSSSSRQRDVAAWFMVSLHTVLNFAPLASLGNRHLAKNEGSRPFDELMKSNKGSCKPPGLGLINFPQILK